MATAKAKPKTTAVAATAKPRTKPKAKPASEAAAKKPSMPKVVLETGTFIKFGGYRSPIDADDMIFKEGDTLYVVEVETTEENGVLYSVIPAADIAAYETDPDSVNGAQLAPSEVTELKGAALEKAHDTFMPIVMLGALAELMDKEGGDAVAVAISLNESIQKQYFWLGGALAAVLQSGAYLTENGGEYSGESAFGDFCQAEFAFKESKGRSLARMYQTYSAMENFDPAMLDSVGWSKAVIAQRFVTAENVSEILELAEGTSQRDLANALKVKYVKENTTASGKAASRGNTIARTSITFRFDEDAAAGVEMAITACMKQRGIESRDLALEAICVEWANEHVEADSTKKRIQQKAAKAAKVREAAAKPAVATTAKAKPKAKPTTAKATEAA